MLRIWGHSSTLQSKLEKVLTLAHVFKYVGFRSHSQKPKGLNIWWKIRGSINGDPPIAGWFIMQHPKKMDDLGVPQFRKYPNDETMMPKASKCNVSNGMQGLVSLVSNSFHENIIDHLYADMSPSQCRHVVFQIDYMKN